MTSSGTSPGALHVAPVGQLVFPVAVPPHGFPIKYTLHKTIIPTGETSKVHDQGCLRLATLSARDEELARVESRVVSTSGCLLPLPEIQPSVLPTRPAQVPQLL